MADSGPRSGLSLLRYFKSCRKDSCQISLPNSTGPLSKKVDSAAIEEANKEVTAVIGNTGGKRKPYLKLTDEQRATIGKYICHRTSLFHGGFSARLLKESTVCRWKKAYLQDFQSCRREGKDRAVKESPKRKTGRPLMMGENLDRQVHAYLRDLGKVGDGVNKELAIASARGIIWKRTVGYYSRE